MLSYSSRAPASRRSMLTALSISSLKDSSKVFTDQLTRALGKVFMRSRSRSTRSLFVAIERRMPLP